MNQQLLEKILKSPRLPSLPTVALQIIDLTQQPDVSISTLADAIRNDPALSSKILMLEGDGDYEAAAEFTSRMGVVDASPGRSRMRREACMPGNPRRRFSRMMRSKRGITFSWGRVVVWALSQSKTLAASNRQRAPSSFWVARRRAVSTQSSL